MKRENRSKPGTVTVGNVIVRIYKRVPPTASGKCRTVFEVADYTSGLRRLRGFTDPKEAKCEAEKIARQLATGESTAATMRNTEAASFGRAIELLRPTGASLEAAAATFAKCFEILGGELHVDAARFYASRHKQTTPKLLSDVIAELLAVKESRGAAPRYLEDLRSRLRRVAQGFHKDASNVATAEIQAWLDAQKLSRQGYSDYRNRLHLLFNFAVARGYSIDNPVAGVEKIKARGGDVAIFSPSAIAKLLSAASPEFLPCLAIGAFAGLRSAEIERLAWADVDLVGRHITVGAKQAKTASRRLIPIHDNLAAWLAPYAGRQGMVWPGTHFAFYHDGRQDTAKAAGVEWKSNALRHSYASYRFAQTGDAGRVAGELGNSAAVVHRHYRELVKPNDAAAWFAVKPAEPANVVPFSLPSEARQAPCQ
jgi:integrase